MAIYTIDAHDAQGGIKREYTPEKRAALSRARRLVDSGEYIRAEIIMRNGASAKHIRTVCAPLSAADIAARQADYPKAR